MSLKLFKYTHHNLSILLPVLFREKLYYAPLLWRNTPNEIMTDLVVQRTFDQGEEGGGIIILWIGTLGAELSIPSDGYD